MADSLVIDWLNENELRAYPFKDIANRYSNLGYKLEDNVILDASISYTTTISTPVGLIQVVSLSDRATFYISGLSTIQVMKNEVFPYYYRSTTGQLIVFGAGVASIPVGTHLFTNANFESSVSYEYDGEWAGVSSLTFDAYSPMTGVIEFSEGFQFGIDITGQKISLSCGGGRGESVGCNAFSGVTPDCDEIISYINGIGPDGKHILHLFNGGGVVILEDPDNHRIFIGLSNDPTTDICKPVVGNPGL